MKSKLIKIFTITSQLLLVSIFITIMLENSTFTSEEVVVENANFYKTSDKVGQLFSMQSNNLKLEETIALQKEEVVEELIVVEKPVVEQPVVETQKEENKVEEGVETPVVEEPKKEEVKQILTTVDISKYKNYENVGFNVTTENTNYELNEKDFNLLVAVVSAETSGHVDDMLGVISVILNSCEPTSTWSSNYNDGTNPIVQITARGQFEVYANGRYKKYLPGGSMYDKEKRILASEVVKDALNGVRNNNYLGFNAWHNTSYSNNYVTEGGNRFR